MSDHVYLSPLAAALLAAAAVAAIAAALGAMAPEIQRYLKIRSM
jgi:hypothetical protein